MRKQASKQETVPPMTLPEEQPDELTLLRGFRDLIAERWGYWAGRKTHQQDMAEATKDQTKAVREATKTVNEAVESYILEPSDELRTKIVTGRKNLASAKKTVATAREPFVKKMTPLAKAVRYCDNVAIPDSLKELGCPIQPRYSLSSWVQDAIKPKK